MLKENLIEGLLKGDTSTIRYIYDNLFYKVERYIKSRSGSRKDAEDVFHDALLIITEKLNKDNQCIVSTFEGYFFTICKNLWRRKIVGKNKVTNLDNVTPVYEEHDLAKAYLEQEQWELYKEKFEKLSDKCKNLLQMVFKKRTYKDIVLEFSYASLTAARQRVFKCKSKLIKLIQDDNKFLRLKK